MNSIILHELYFDGLSGEGERGKALGEALNRDFGSIERWRVEMLAHGMVMYDALYAWLRKARNETHGWPPPS